MQHLPSSRSGFRKAVLQAALLCAAAVVAAVAANALRPDSLPWVGDWSATARLTDDTGESLSIDIDTARHLFENGQAVFLDARPPTDYTAGHIQGALSLPWHEAEERFFDYADRLDPEGTIVTYCDGETCELSTFLAQFLIDMGFARVKVLHDGWNVWRRANLPVETS